MEYLLVVLLVIAAILAIAMFSPVMILVDSRQRQVRVRWLFALGFQAPLPGTAGQKFFTIFRRPIPIHRRQPRAEATGVDKERPAKNARPGAKPRAMKQFVIRCLGDSDIRPVLARQLALLLRRIFHSANLARTGGDISMADPAFNGMVAGALAATNMASRSGMRVNFRGENSLFLEAHLHPHRILKAFLFFLAGLPHLAVFRQWRSFAAAQRH
ncbi:MAG: hypothetical protein EPN47_09415 [Acidobacteria bacterium]|nr:MAG: hypothetical protein EPN47_09415 [Acidobacteriota bacterium]